MPVTILCAKDRRVNRQIKSSLLCPHSSGQHRPMNAVQGGIGL